MKRNMGNVDRSIRIVVGVILGALALTGRAQGTAGIVLAIIAVVFLVTSFVGHCPAYVPLKLSTHKKPSPPA